MLKVSLISFFSTVVKLALNAKLWTNHRADESLETVSLLMLLSFTYLHFTLRDYRNFPNRPLPTASRRFYSHFVKFPLCMLPWKYLYERACTSVGDLITPSTLVSQVVKLTSALPTASRARV